MKIMGLDGEEGPPGALRARISNIIAAFSFPYIISFKIKNDRDTRWS